MFAEQISHFKLTSTGHDEDEGLHFVMCVDLSA
jgi:hypothetical protein